MSVVKIVLPAMWLIMLLAGLPQLAETVYTPSLPDIARALGTPEPMVEYTLTIYLFGFAMGTFLWGKLSDHWGRKPCVIGGLVVFIIGCWGCYASQTIEVLMMNRLIQGLGGSVGSVLGQAICRDAFQGVTLGKAYSSVGMALALFPAIGPVIGGGIAECFGWSAIFLFLTLFAGFLTMLTAWFLSETHPKHHRKPFSVVDVGLKLIQDRQVLGYALIVGGCNGISFSYFAEGSFFLMEGLGLSPSQYGASFFFIAAASLLGGLWSKKLQNRGHPQQIMVYGLWIILTGAVLFSLFAVCHSFLMPFSQNVMIGLAIGSQMVVMFGSCMATSNALAVALVDYRWCVGTASSLFGLSYYILVSLLTFGMGSLHNGSLLPMPFYFLAIALLMLGVERLMFRRFKSPA